MKTQTHQVLPVFSALAVCFICGFGGCSAPEKPIRALFPALNRSAGLEGDEHDRTVGSAWVDLDSGLVV